MEKCEFGVSSIHPTVVTRSLLEQCISHKPAKLDKTLKLLSSVELVNDLGKMVRPA